MSDQIDWPGIRANAVTMGIRGAARAAAVNLTPEERERFVKRVLKRAEREGWQEAKRAAMSSAGGNVVNVVSKPGAPAIPLSSNVVNGADSVSITLGEMGRDTKLAGMEYAKLVTEHARGMARAEPERALEAAGNVKAALQSAAIAGDWQAGPQVGVVISLGREVG